MDIMLFCSAMFLFFFFMQKTAYEMRIIDWSSDVCSSDLASPSKQRLVLQAVPGARARSGRAVGERKIFDDNQAAGFRHEQARVRRPQFVEPERGTILARKFCRTGGDHGTPAHGLDPAPAPFLANDESRSAGPEFGGPVGLSRRAGVKERDRKSVVAGKRGSVRVVYGGRRILKKNNIEKDIDRQATVT